MPQYSSIPDNDLWEQLILLQGESFSTSGRGSRPGKPFTYTIRGGEMIVSAKAKTITKATVLHAYENALHLQSVEGYVKGPKKLNVPGAASYLYPVFLRLGIITRTPLTLLTGSDIILSDTDERDDTMPRPKGSKNKKNTTAVTLQSVESIDEKIAAAEAAIASLTEELKARKTELKELTKQKAEAEAAAAAKKAEEDKAKLLEAIEASGKTVDEIIALINQ